VTWVVTALLMTCSLAFASERSLGLGSLPKNCKVES
jgi:hypothetical protein